MPPPMALGRGAAGNGGAAIVRRSDGDLRSPAICPLDRGAEMFPAVRSMIPPADEKKRESPPGDEQLDSSSSSIGRNSDCSDGSDDEDGEEVVSAARGPLFSTDSLQEALPLRRGISKFYAGKSKSFTSFAEVTSASCKDLGKPENAYTRKRKNLLAFSIHCPPPRPAGGTVKRAANAARPPPHPNLNLPGRGSPPPRCHFSARSLSLTDLPSASDPGLN